MEEIAERIFFEKNYPGVVSAVLFLEKGTLLIDLPLRIDDRQSWLKTIADLGGRNHRLMVMLDAHSDRLSSTHMLEFPILTHKNVLQVIPGFFTSINQVGSQENLKSEGNQLSPTVRWALPELTYTSQISLQWDQQPVVVTHHPGVHPAASWVEFEPEKVIFVGDTVVIKEPPFLDCCDLNLWIENLNRLSSNDYQDYKIIGGRNGVVRQRSIIKLMKFLATVKEMVLELSMMESQELALADRVNKLMKTLNYDRELENYYKSRLTRGLKQLLFRYEKGELLIKGADDAGC